MRTKGRVGRYWSTSHRSDTDSRDKTTQYGPNGYAGERGAAPPPEQLPVPATNAPPAFPGEAAFRRIPAPLECAGPRALFDRGTISSKKGVLPVPGPPNGFYFRFPTRKNDGPSRTCHGTRPQDGRRYAVPPSPTGQASKSPAFQARNVRPPPLMPQVLTRRSEPIHPSSQARSPAPKNPKADSGSDHHGPCRGFRANLKFGPVLR